MFLFSLTLSLSLSLSYQRMVQNIMAAAAVTVTKLKKAWLRVAIPVHLIDSKYATASSQSRKTRLFVVSGMEDPDSCAGCGSDVWFTIRKEEGKTIEEAEEKLKKNGSRLISKDFHGQRTNTNSTLTVFPFLA